MGWWWWGGGGPSVHVWWVFRIHHFVVSAVPGTFSVVVHGFSGGGGVLGLKQCEKHCSKVLTRDYYQSRSWWDGLMRLMIIITRDWKGPAVFGFDLLANAFVNLIQCLDFKQKTSGRRVGRLIRVLTFTLQTAGVIYVVVYSRGLCPLFQFPGRCWCKDAYLRRTQLFCLFFLFFCCCF